MLKPLLARLIALWVIAVPVYAQVPPANPYGAFGERQPDAEQLAALMANRKRTMQPASFVLSHKAELALTAEQVQRIELLAHTEDDSAVVRQIRTTAAMTRQMKERASGNAPPSTGWAGPINEKQIRDDAIQMAGVQADIVLTLLRDRQAVGNVLTGTQIERIMQLEMSDMMSAMKPKQP